MEEQNMEARDAVIEEWLEEKSQNDANSNVWISGRIIQEAQFDHKAYDMEIYRFMLEVKRKSGVFDIIPVKVSEKAAKIDDIQKGKYASVKGEIRTHNRRGNEGKKHLDLYVLTMDVEIFDSEQGLGEMANVNTIYLRGCLCKTPNYRVTPMKREITDLMVAVEYGYSHKTSYVPCITWGNVAQATEKMEIGDEIKLLGRFQSRTYIKRISETQVEKRTTYEVSTIRLL